MQLIGQSLFYSTAPSVQLPERELKYLQYQDTYYWLKWAINGSLMHRAYQVPLLRCCGKEYLQFLIDQRNILYHPTRSDGTFDLDQLLEIVSVLVRGLGDSVSAHNLQQIMLYK